MKGKIIQVMGPVVDVRVRRILTRNSEAIKLY